MWINVIVDCTLVLVVVDSVLRVTVNVGGQVVDDSTLVHKEKVEHRSGGWRLSPDRVEEKESKRKQKVLAMVARWRQYLLGKTGAGTGHRCSCHAKAWRHCFVGRG